MPKGNERWSALLVVVVVVLIICLCLALYVFSPDEIEDGGSSGPSDIESTASSWWGTASTTSEAGTTSGSTAEQTNIVNPEKCWMLLPTGCDGPHKDKPRNEWFSTGLTEDSSTELSREECLSDEWEGKRRKVNMRCNRENTQMYYGITPSTPAQVTGPIKILNEGESCLRACGSAGPCPDFCGTGACCQEGDDDACGTHGGCPASEGHCCTKITEAPPAVTDTFALALCDKDPKGICKSVQYNPPYKPDGDNYLVFVGKDGEHLAIDYDQYDKIWERGGKKRCTARDSNDETMAGAELCTGTTVYRDRRNPDPTCTNIMKENKNWLGLTRQTKPGARYRPECYFSGDSDCGDLRPGDIKFIKNRLVHVKVDPSKPDTGESQGPEPCTEGTKEACLARGEECEWFGSERKGYCRINNMRMAEKTFYLREKSGCSV